jgi:hypothetical protein
MLRTARRVLALSAAALVVGGLASASAQATVLHVNGERSAISLGPGASQFLATYHITVAVTGPASVGSDGSLILPITGGSVYTGSTDGTIFHSGGVTLSHEGRSLSFRDFVLVREAGHTWLNALLNDRGWVPYARVDFFAVQIIGSEALVTGELKLSEATAEAFNWLVGSNVVSAGVEIGKLKSTISFG